MASLVPRPLMPQQPTLTHRGTRHPSRNWCNSESGTTKSYSFEINSSGLAFIDALAHAAARGVDTRVIVGGIGERYWHPRVSRLLATRGVTAASFLPPRLLTPYL